MDRWERRTGRRVEESVVVIEVGDDGGEVC